METLIVACVQQKMRLPRSQEEHKDDLRRFLRSAATKRAPGSKWPGGAFSAQPTWAA